METSSKREFRQYLAIFKYILIAVLLISSVLLMKYGVQSCLRYGQVKGRGVEVQARIAHVYKDWDAENMDEYEVYVEYEYHGQTYTVYYDTYSSKLKVEALGDTVTVVINPDNPGEKMSSVKEAVNIGIVGGVFCLACAVAATAIPTRMDYVFSFGMSSENIRKDLLSKIGRRRLSLWLLIIGLGLIVFWVVFRKILGVFMPVFGALLVVLGVYRLIRDLRDLTRIRNGHYRIRPEKVIKKYTDSDSDGTAYMLVYGSGEETWVTNVSRNEYEKVQPDDYVTAVYLDGDKKPLFHYKLVGGKWVRR